MLNGLQAVLYRDINIFMRKAKKQIIASSISPLLYLIAFGWGFGSHVQVGDIAYTSFLIPGLITMASLNQSFGINGEINISRFYFHTFDEYLIAPVSTYEIVLGEVIYGMMRGFLGAFIVFMYALIFNVKINFSLLFIIAIVLHTFMFSSLGVALAMFVRDHASQQSLNTFVITPMIFLCGTFFPIEKLPVIFKAIIHLLPLTYSTSLIRSTLTGTHLYYWHFLMLIVFCAVFFTLAIYSLKKVEV
ncbi:MAG: ABC transporter permease [Candidatus Magnetoovum sp. WYHC-5]|nr:ABC transporter permease [Candidatus Magnetoovum sp. WYHC-5]